MAKPLSKKLEKKIKSGVKTLEQALPIGSSKKTPTVAALAGVAVAGAAGVAAAVHFLRKGPNGSATFRLVPNDDGWAVKAEGTADPLATFETKKDALTWARETASSEAPSELVIHGSDGEVQTSHTYEAAAS